MDIILLIAAAVFLFLTIRRLVHLFFMNLIIGRRTLNFRKFNKTKNLNLFPNAEKTVNWLNTQEFRPVTIKSSHDGINLSGHFLASGEAKRTLLLFHGWRSEFRNDFADMAEKLYQNGCNLLFVEQRAHGLSGGKYISFGALERYDCIDWLNYLNDTKHEFPIYLTGLSMGASTILMAAELKMPPAVKGIIADSGFTSPYEIIVRVAKNVFRLNNRTVKRVDRLCSKKSGIGLNGYTTLKAMSECRIPVLFIHGTADNLIPFEMTMQNFSACRSRKKLLLVEGANHCKSFAHDAENYLNTVRSFFGWDGESQDTGDRYLSRQVQRS